MKDVQKIFRNVDNQLRQASWFGEDWRTFNRRPYIQLYKSNWFNENNSGIHFETFIDTPQPKNKAFPVLIHTVEDCMHRAEFVHQFLELEKERIKAWGGYSFHDQGYTIFKKTLTLNFKNLENRIFGEFSQLWLLAESIDETLLSIG